MTVERLLNEMSAAELAEWIAFYTVEPFGEDWKQTSYVCTMTGNASGGKRGGKPFEPSDFLPVKPSIRHTAKRQTPEQMLNIFRLISKQK